MALRSSSTLDAFRTLVTAQGTAEGVAEGEDMSIRVGTGCCSVRIRLGRYAAGAACNHNILCTTD
eukprot:scaffold3703_cov56-Phaeocystis_antarctica.AAC.2